VTLARAESPLAGGPDLDQCPSRHEVEVGFEPEIVLQLLLLPLVAPDAALGRPEVVDDRVSCALHQHKWPEFESDYNVTPKKRWDSLLVYQNQHNEHKVEPRRS
jgi:hypothetical protein